MTVSFITDCSFILTSNGQQSATILNEPGQRLETPQNQDARLQELCVNEMTGL